MAGTLYVVATPIGNLEDLSPRAVRVLKAVAMIACEDTRHARKLLDRHGIRTPSTSYHEHNERQRTPHLVKRLREGEDLALISDAGTPLVSDPGYRLVRACREAELSILPVPGPAAALAALSVSGLPSDSFLFAGFLPARAGAQKEKLARLAGATATLVFYLSPHRLAATLERMAAILGNRQAFLAREMTKLHETHTWGRLQQIIAAVRAEKARGEYTLVVEGASTARSAESGVDPAAYVRGLVETEGLSRRDAIARAARDLGLPRREIYRRVEQSRGRCR